MHIILFSLILLVFGCGQKEKTTIVVPHVDTVGGSNSVVRRWDKVKFPLVIKVPLNAPCLLNPSNPPDDTIPSLLNCGSTDPDLELLDANSNALIDVLNASVNAWNTALNFTAIQLQYQGSNQIFADPEDYVRDSEEAIHRVAWLPDFFGGRDADEIASFKQTLAITVYTYGSTSQVLRDADLLFNLRNFDFTTFPKQLKSNPASPTDDSYTRLCLNQTSQNDCLAAKVCNWTGSQCKIKPAYMGNIDLQSVVVHELGHFLGLQHIASTTDDKSVMQSSVSSETRKVILSPGDICRINQLYRDIFTTCDMATAASKFCYSTTNVQSVGVVNNECHITACNPGFILNDNKTACKAQ